MPVRPAAASSIELGGIGTPRTGLVVHLISSVYYNIVSDDHLPQAGVSDKKPSGAAPGLLGGGHPDGRALKIARALRTANAGTATDRRNIGVEAVPVPKPSAWDPGLHWRNGIRKLCLIP